MSNARKPSSAEALTHCDWASGDALYEQYHDEEWGAPCFDDHHLFELLVRETARASRG